MEPMDVVQNIEWLNLRPKRAKRPSEFLNNPKKRGAHPNHKVLLLPSPALVSASQIIKDKENNLIDSEQNKPTQQKSSFRNIFFIFNPAIIIGYIHVILNAFILFSLVYAVGYLIYFATVDISYKINTKREEARVLIKQAKNLYEINKCDPSSRVPALDKQCTEWECLMKNGMSGIKYTRIVVEMLADVADGFVSKFSYKSILFFMCFFVVYLIFRR